MNAKSGYQLMDTCAKAPTRAHDTDVGYDITLVKLLDNGRYDSGVVVKPPSNDYYFDLVARSSLYYKHGYILSNAVGIIDPEYRGTVQAALIKIDKNKPDLPLPCTCLQLILRRRYNLVWVQKELNETARGEGGFGSTG